MSEAFQPALPILSKPENISLTVSEEMLIQRAHVDYQKILVEKEFGGGFGGTRVFLILPVKSDGSHHARVVTKIGPRADLVQEKENYDDHAGRALPFNTAQVRELHQDGDQAALNYVFAGGDVLGETVTLQEYYLDHNAEKIKAMLEGLLDKALGPAWYGQSHPFYCLFQEEYGLRLPGHEQLTETTNTIFPNLLVGSREIQIPDVEGIYPNPLKIYLDLLNRTLQGRRSFVHGDLHLRNVLVDNFGRGWLIDFAKVKERHNLFDFIKLETYIRLMGLAQEHEQKNFSLSEYAEFEIGLNTATLNHRSALPENPQLRKAHSVILAIRRIARKYMGPDSDFKNEYFPALSLYCLAMLKYYPSNGLVPTKLIFITTCILDQFILYLDKYPTKKNNPNKNKTTSQATSIPTISDNTSSSIRQEKKDEVVGSEGVFIDGNAGENMIIGNDNTVEQTKNENHTDGGAYIEGDVKTGRDFIGRDQVKIDISNIIVTGSAPPLLDYPIGREDVIDQLKMRLGIGINKQSTSPLGIRTIIRGLPGVGKTAIVSALAYDNDVKKAFPDGILYTSLGSDPGDLPSKICSWANSMGMNIRENVSGKDASEISRRLNGLLSNKHVLLIVENVWRPEDFEPFWVSGTACHTLITTRSTSVAQDLATYPEDIFWLDVLDKYDDKKSQSIEILRKFARDVVDTYPKESLELARELGGIPLALRVAGNLLRKEHGIGLDVGQLIAELRDKRNKILEAKTVSKIITDEVEERVFPTVEALLHQSIEQLSEKSKNCFIYLGVFARDPARFRLDAMKAVWKVENPADVVRELVDKGLLEFIRDGQYYEMHNLFHDYIQSFLVDEGATKARQNHFDFFQRVSQQLEETHPNTWGDTMQTLEALYPEIKQALTNFKQEQITPDNERLQKSIQMIETLEKYWKVWNQVDDEQIRILEEAFGYATMLNNTIRQADFARRLGRAKTLLGDWEGGLSSMRQCEIALGDDNSEQAKSIRGHMFIHRAAIYYANEDLEKAEKDCKKGLRIVTPKKQLEIYAEGQNILGAIKLANSELSMAYQAFQESLLAWEKVGDEFEIYRVKDNLRTVRYYLGDIGYVREEDEAALQSWKKFPYSIGYASALTNLGLIYYVDQRYEDAIQKHKESIERSETITDPRIKTLARDNLAWPYIALGMYDEAENILKESLEIYGGGEYSFDAQRCLAEVEIGRGNYPKAIDMAEAVANGAKEEKNILEEGAALRVLGQAHRLSGDHEKAREELEKSFSILRDHEYKYESFLTLQELINLHRATGETEKMQEETNIAQNLSKEMGLHGQI